MFHHHYYAEYKPYGLDTRSEGDTLYRFDDRRARDKYVHNVNVGRDFTDYKAEAVYVIDMRHKYMTDRPVYIDKGVAICDMRKCYKQAEFF